MGILPLRTKSFKNRVDLVVKREFEYRALLARDATKADFRDLVEKYKKLGLQCSIMEINSRAGLIKNEQMEFRKLKTRAVKIVKEAGKITPEDLRKRLGITQRTGNDLFRELKKCNLIMLLNKTHYAPWKPPVQRCSYKERYSSHPVEQMELL